MNIRKLIGKILTEAVNAHVQVDASGDFNLPEGDLYRLYTYDVWGNEDDGYEVNNIHKTQTTINIDEQFEESEIIQLLHTEGILNVNVDDLQHINLDFSHDDVISINDGSYPLGELRKETGIESDF